MHGDYSWTPAICVNSPYARCILSLYLHIYVGIMIYLLSSQPIIFIALLLWIIFVAIYKLITSDSRTMIELTNPNKFKSPPSWYLNCLLVSCATGSWKLGFNESVNFHWNKSTLMYQLCVMCDFQNNSCRTSLFKQRMHATHRHYRPDRHWWIG